MTISRKFAVALTVAAMAFFVSGCQNVARPPDSSVEEDRRQVTAILKILDVYGKDLDATLNAYSDELVQMAQGSRAITNKAELRKVLQVESSYGTTEMKHELVTLNSYHDMVLTRGRVKGTWTPPEGAPVPFETNNVITFRRMTDGTLKVWQVIFNRVALENYKDNP